MRLSTLFSLPPLVFFFIVVRIILTPVLYVCVCVLFVVVVVLWVFVYVWCFCFLRVFVFLFVLENLSLLVFKTKSFYVVQASLKLRVF